MDLRKNIISPIMVSDESENSEDDDGESTTSRGETPSEVSPSADAFKPKSNFIFVDPNTQKQPSYFPGSFTSTPTQQRITTPSIKYSQQNHPVNPNHDPFLEISPQPSLIASANANIKNPSEFKFSLVKPKFDLESDSSPINQKKPDYFPSPFASTPIQKRFMTPSAKYSQQNRPVNSIRDPIREIPSQPPLIMSAFAPTTATNSTRFNYFEPMNPKDERWKQQVDFNFLNKKQLHPYQSDNNIEELEALTKKMNIKDLSSSSSAKKLAVTAEEKIVELLESIPDTEEGLAVDSDPEELKITLMQHQKAGLAWLVNREKGIHKGGILADDMGLGKTVQTISLILKHRPKEDGNCQTTLIVAPLALIKQWESEIQTKTTRGSLRTLIHHGNNRTK
ncbi:hypothetical protein HK096_006272, partial [Nowakowskiella sp. JEL0078]